MDLNRPECFGAVFRISNVGNAVPGVPARSAKSLLPGRRDFFDACGIGGTADLRIKSCTLCEASPKIHKHDAKYVQVHGQTAADLLI